MRRLLALFAASAAAACGGESHQVWVVNERAEPVVLVLEVVGEDLNPVPDEEPLDYTIPANSEACTYCGTGPMPRARVFIYAAEGCVQLGAAVLLGESAYVLTVPSEGLIILEPGSRPDPSGGRQIGPVATACG
jgi:hypothetical protein